MKKYILVLSLFLLSSYHLFCSNPASPDTSFGTQGTASSTPASGYVNQAQAVAIDSLGSIVNVGYAASDAVIVKFLSNGTIDPNFGVSGVISLDLGYPSAGYDVAIDSNDNIIIVGYITENGINNALIARYTKYGQLDTTFNTTGYIITQFGGQSELYGIQLDTTGNIIVTGWTTISGTAQMLIARYTSAGILDTSFGGTGYVTSPIGSTFGKGRALALQTISGTEYIVVAGQADVGGTQGLFVIRYKSNGDQDTTFANGQVVVFPFSSYNISAAYGITVQPADNSIYVVGSAMQSSGTFQDNRYTLIKLTENGSLDTSFNDTGIIISTSSEDGIQANGVALQSNAQIVTCGFAYSTTNNYSMVVNRYNTNGTQDTTFTFTPTANSPTLAFGLIIQSNGAIVICGTQNTTGQ